MLYESLTRDAYVMLVGFVLLFVATWRFLRRKELNIVRFGLGIALLAANTVVTPAFPVPAANETAVLISGASSGIGLALAKAFAEEGFLVFAGCRKSTDMDRVDQLHENIRAVKMDVLEQTELEAVRGELEQLRDRNLKILIPNAGVYIPTMPVELTKLEDEEFVMKVNHFGTVRIFKTFSSLLRASGGRIIVHSSQQVDGIFPFMQAYAASKAALEAYTTAFRRELLLLNSIDPEGNKPVAVSIMRTGMVKSEILRDQTAAAKSSRKFCNTNGGRRNLIPTWNSLICERWMINTGLEISGADESITIESFLHAATSNRPRVVYYIGIDAAVSAFMSDNFAHALYDRLMNSICKLIVFVKFKDIFG